MKTMKTWVNFDMISVTFGRGGVFFAITENINITVFNALPQMLRRKQSSTRYRVARADYRANPETWIEQT